MRFKFHKNAVAYTAYKNGTAKVFFNSSISLPKKEEHSYIKVFDKLIRVK